MPVMVKQALRKYFGEIALGVRTTYGGMKITWRNLKRRPVTLMYPEVRPDIAVGHRGIHGYDEEKCISCDMCATACPVDCIYIESVGRGKDALMTQFDIDYTKCLFCDLCTPPCPTECIWMTQEYDLASYRKEDCIINFARTKTVEEKAAHEEKLKKKEEEKKARAAAKKAGAQKSEGAGDEAGGDAGEEN
jgi:NADH-quinone oxidoreductase subunit I